MLKKLIYKIFFVFLFISQIAYGDTFGFVADGGNYYKTVNESSDGTIQIGVTESGNNGYNLTFRLYVDYTTNVSTSNWKEGTKLRWKRQKLTIVDWPS